MATEKKDVSEFSQYLMGVTHLRELNKALASKRGRKPQAKVEERSTLLTTLDGLWAKVKTGAGAKFQPIHRRTT
jgi:hypothetical protein